MPEHAKAKTMYAVIKTGGKQYRVQPGDVLVVEKLEGEPGAKVAFGEVLMLGDGDAISVGAPTVEGAAVNATLIETRKGEKVKIFKKIRRQGYRRTRGHRQFESVLRVTSIAAGGKEAKWDGEVKLVTKAELDARARNLAFQAPGAAAEAAPAPVAKAKAAPAKAKAPKVDPEVIAEAADSAQTNAPVETAAEAPAPKKAAAPKAKAEAKPAEAKPAEAKEAAPKKAAAPKAAKAEPKAETAKAPAKKPAAKKKTDEA